MKTKLMTMLILFLLAASSTITAQQKNSTEKNAQAPLIPMRDFFRNPEKTAFALSPNGEYLAFLQPWEKRLNVFVQKVGSDTAVRATSAKERDIPGFGWKGNNRLVFVQDKGGDENFHLYAVSVDGSNSKDLTPFEKVRAQIIDSLEENEAELLVGLNKRVPQIHDVYRINVNTGEMQMVAENPGNITVWKTDWSGKLRVAIATDGVNNTLLYRKTEAEKFTPVLTTSFKETVSPLFFTFDNQHVYVATNIGQNASAPSEVRKHPPIFCCNFTILRSRSVALLSNGTSRSVINLSTSSLLSSNLLSSPAVGFLGLAFSLCSCSLASFSCLLSTSEFIFIACSTNFSYLAMKLCWLSWLNCLWPALPPLSSPAAT